MSEQPHFEVLARLGEGGMGEVFLAAMRRAGEEQRVALKRLKAGGGSISERYPHFEREAHVCALLDHPNVVRLHAWGVDSVGPYLALELVEGRSVAALLREQLRLDEPLALHAAFSIARDAALGLRYAHARGVVHRDVSLDNVLVSFDGLAKVTDFGVAKVIGGESLTSTGVVVGKYGYLAPELFEGAKATIASDVFAYAATIYRLVTGVSPFPGRTEAELLRAVLSTDPVPVRQLREVPEALARWLHAALEKKPGKRPTSLEGVIAALDACLPGPPEEHHAAVRACLERAWPKEERRHTDMSLPAVQLATATATVRRPLRHTVALILTAGALIGLGLGFAIAASAPAPANAAPFRLEPAPPLEAQEEGELRDAQHVRSPLTPALSPTGEREAQSSSPSSPGAEVQAPQPPPRDATAHPQRGKPPRVRPTPIVERPRPPRPGTLRVFSFRHVRFYVDGELRGETPMLAPLELPNGAHAVRAVNEKLAFDQTFPVTIANGAETELRVVLP